MRRTVLVIAPHMSGHHPVYLRWIVSGALDQGFAVCIGTYESNLSHSFLQSLRSGHVSFATLEDPRDRLGDESNVWGLIRREFRYWRTWRQFYAAARKRGDVFFVFVVSVDYAANAVAILGSPFGPTPWAGITMRPAFHYSQMGIKRRRDHLDGLKRILFERLARNRWLKALITNDLALSQFAGASQNLRGRILYLAEPVRDLSLLVKAEAKRRLHILDTDRVVLVYGVITLRKGVDALIEATNSPRWPDNVCILLAGTQGHDVQCLLNSERVKQLRRSGRLVELSGYLSDEEEDLAFSASDVVWVGYRNHFGMSGVLVQAARAGRPVIATDEGLIGWLARMHRTGVLTPLTDPNLIASAVVSCLNDFAADPSFSESVATAFIDHTIDRAQATVLSVICADCASVGKDVHAEGFTRQGIQ